MKGGAKAEWETLRDVLVHEPGIEVFFALLSPSANLYERFFNREEAIGEHRELVRLMEEDFGVRVHHLITSIRDQAIRNKQAMSELADIATRRLKRKCRGEICALSERVQNEIVNPLPLDARDPGHLFDIIRLNPILIHSTRGIEVRLGRPLHNLYFMRDQHGATDIGMVSGRMATPERQDEVEICSLGIKSTGAGIASAVRDGSFEGGDFIPAGSFALLGCGSRTNKKGIVQILASGIAFDEVAVVHEPSHPLIQGRDPMVCMHLDTYFNIPGEGLAVGCPHLLEAAEVTVFFRTSGGYQTDGTQTNLAEYLQAKGFDLIGINTLEQICYATNFLCVRNGVCLVPDVAQVAPVILEQWRMKARSNPRKYGALLAQAEHEYRELSVAKGFFPRHEEVSSYGLSMKPVALTNATGGYGGAHCMTCVLSR